MSRRTWEQKSEEHSVFTYGTITPYGRTFHCVQLTRALVTPGYSCISTKFLPHNPAQTTDASFNIHAV